MKKNKWYLLIILLPISIVGFLLLHQAKSISTISYFPIDRTASFLYAYTVLNVSPSEIDRYEIHWDSKSKTDQSQYLRQDVSLLYSDGKLKGIRSKWEENTDTISMEQNLFESGEHKLETITYHHGEIHHSNDQITSVHTMSNYQLYMIIDEKNNISSFVNPKNNLEKEKKQWIDLNKDDPLFSHWNKLMNYFTIDPDNYYAVPLTELYVYDNKSLPSLTQAQTDKIMGQLWEGLYKNYVIPALENQDSAQQYANYTPLILFDKNNTHLLVIFELNNKKEKLIQRYSL